MAKIAYGNVVGKLVDLAYVPGYMLFTAVSIYSFSISLNTVLPATPRMAITIALGIVALSGALYGVEALARTAVIILPFTIGVLLLSCVIVFNQGHWTGVFPYPASLSRSVYGAFHLVPIFFGLNISLMLNPNYDHRKHNSIWLMFFTVGISALTVLFVYVTALRVIGYEGLRVLTHPIDFIMQLIQLRGVVVQRLGIALIFMITAFEIMFLANHTWAISELVVQTLSLQNKHRKSLSLIYMIMVLVIIQLIPTQQVWDEIVQMLGPLSWLYLLAEPIIKLLVSYIRGVPKTTAGQT